MENKQENQIGEKLERMCREKGISFYALSAVSGVALTTIMHVVDGSTRTPGIYTVMRLCRGLEISMADFLEDLE